MNPFLIMALILGLLAVCEGLAYGSPTSAAVLGITAGLLAWGGWQAA